MRVTRGSATRLLPDGTPLKNRLLVNLPGECYDPIAKDLRMIDVDEETGELFTSYANIVENSHGPRMALVIDAVKLLEKHGGKSGSWVAE